MDENSSVSFNFSVSGGATAVENISLNDLPDALDAYDLGASHGSNGSNNGDGQLWAVSILNNTGTPNVTSGIVHMRPVGSGTRVSAGQTAQNVDRAGFNQMVYTTFNTAYFYTHGGSANKIYDPTNHSNVGLRDIAFGGGMTFVIDGNGRILRYTAFEHY